MQTQPAKFDFYKWQPVRSVFRWAHGVILPGVNGASLFQVGKFFVRELRNLKLTVRAAAVTYNFVMALPPFFLFLFSLIPYLPLRNVEQTIMNTLKLLTPNNKIYNSVRGVVGDFMTTQHHDVLSYGVVLVLFFSSNGMMGLMRCFDKSRDIYKKRTGLQRRWTAIKLTLMLLIVSLIGLSVLIIQTKSLNHMVLQVFHHMVAIKVVSFLILILVVFFVICIIYTYGPSLTRRFPFISAGAVFATSLSIIATSVFFYLVNHFINYNKIYGSIGTLIAFMVWMWLNTIVILLGYELNVSILLGRLQQEDEAIEDDDDDE